MESGNCQFGMVLSPDSKYGTMLRINSFNQMPDGRYCWHVASNKYFLSDLIY